MIEKHPSDTFPTKVEKSIKLPMEIIIPAGTIIGLFSDILFFKHVELSLKQYIFITVTNLRYTRTYICNIMLYYISLYFKKGVNGLHGKYTVPLKKFNHRNKPTTKSHYKLFKIY